MFGEEIGQFYQPAYIKFDAKKFTLLLDFLCMVYCYSLTFT